MKKYLLLLLITSLAGCATNSNVFNINGKNLRLSDSRLIELRERWKGKENKIVVSSLLSKNDIQWSLDYISLIEDIYSKGCESLQVKKTRKFDEGADSDLTGNNVNPGLFDYIWEVQVCDIQRNYRLVNRKDHPSFLLYPLNL